MRTGEREEARDGGREVVMTWDSASHNPDKGHTNPTGFSAGTPPRFIMTPISLFSDGFASAFSTDGTLATQKDLRFEYLLGGKSVQT